MPGLRWALAVLLAAASSGCEPGPEGERAGPPGPGTHVALAVAEQPISATVFVAHDRGFFADEGLDVELISRPTGQTALDEVIAGRAHFATTAETPVVHAALRGDGVSVLATIATTRGGLEVVARGDRGIRTPADLAGRRVGVTIGTNVEFFLDLFLTLHDLDRGDVTLVDTEAGEIVPGLTGGDLDAVVSWEPHTSELRSRLGGDAHRLTEPELYAWFWNVVSREDFPGSDPRATAALLRALVGATRWVTSHPEETRELVSTRLDLEPEAVEAVWGKTRFSVSLDQALLLTMEDQARWVRARRDLAPGALPNFLRFVDPGPLAGVAPRSVAIPGGGGGA